ncbi:TonB-dependent receptor [Nitrobacter sp.]|uniref:TonB-dependent receptor n=1 Tax=Nitrobacter sp. TaxID=29420 RepID=UPI00399D7233
MLKSQERQARGAVLLCATAMSLLFSRAAVSQEQQSQPALPPVVVEPPAHRPASVIPRSASNQHAKPRRARRGEHRRMPPVDVAAQQAAAAAEAYRTREGSEAQGYRPATVTNFGPFGQKPILDVPYSVNVLSTDFLENRLAAQPQDAFKYSPVAGPPTSFAGYGSPSTMLRGFALTAKAIDGMRDGFSGITPLEDKERVEVLTGLTGFLYGGTDVGGMVNFVYKKPTPIPYYSLTVGDYGYLQGFTHLDIGGPIDKEGKFGYRLNIVGQDGSTPVDFQSIRRGLITGAFTWNITPDTKLEFVGSHQDQLIRGVTPTWYPGGDFDYTRVPDPHKLWLQQWASTSDTVDRAQVSFSSHLNDVISVRAAYSFETSLDRGAPYGQNYWDDNHGNYDQYLYFGSASRNNTHSGYTFIDANFYTGSVEHKLTFGAYGNSTSLDMQAGNTDFIDPVFNIGAGPVYINQPPFPPNAASTSYYGTWYKFYTVTQTNMIIGDDIRFNDQWSALIGGNYARIAETDFNRTPPFALQSDQAQTKLTPTASLVFKPVSWASTYVTYSQSFQQGAIVPALPTFTNAGQILPPYLSDEYELGAKANVGGMLLTGALFQINKANQFVQNNGDGTLTYVQDGREIHKGIELTATGKIMPDLRVLGSVTLMDSRVVQTSSPITDDKRPVGVSDRMAKMTMEYDLPFIPGLTLTGGVYYYGPQAVDQINSAFIKSYVTEDLGLRYRTRIPSGQELILRMNVANLTDHAYWMTPNLVGAPRTISFSGQVKF